MSTHPADLIGVTSEIGRLRRIAIHAPDEGVNHIPPRMMQSLLYDDIVDIERMSWEYYQYLEVLYWLLDPKSAQKIPKTDNLAARQKVFDPASDDYIASDYIVDIQHALAKVLADTALRQKIIAAVCGLEKAGLHIAHDLEQLPPKILAKTLVTGLMTNNSDGPAYLFTPLPNLIFTRDTAVTINDHLFITQPAEHARARENLLLQYTAKYSIMAERQNHILFTDPDPGTLSARKRPTIEGGDIMMISPSHLLIGLSSRTNIQAIEQLIRKLFSKKIVEKISVISIPKARDFMHIDTVFTQIKRDMWIIFGPFSKEGHLTRQQETITWCLKDNLTAPGVTIKQFRNLKNGSIEVYDYPFLEDLCEDISRYDFGCRRGAQFIYCGGGEAPFDEREQWTDGCNFLSLKEGVIIGYDRNKKTTEDLRRHDFKIIKAQNFNKQMQQGAALDELITQDTLILLPSAELSRARGGSHCMSLPLARDPWEP